MNLSASYIQFHGNPFGSILKSEEVRELTSKDINDLYKSFANLDYSYQPNEEE